MTGRLLLIASHVLIAGGLLPCVGSVQVVSAAEPVQFSRDVLPLLSDACFHCHGPDEEARQADLRLDTQEGVFRLRDGVAVVIPHDAEGSELVQRLHSTDVDLVMPPPRGPRQLTPTERDMLKRWVAEGAVWGTHWSFSPMEQPTPPMTTNTTWPRGPIDQFVLAKLEQEGLSPAASASPEQWLRRVTFDLTGLPPTIAEIDSYLSAVSSQSDHAQASEQVVNRLLQSPRYAERMATEWLDVARYADTHGYQADRYRAMWPYRDWVLRSFQSNQRYDEFLTWQLAGDLLPEATRDQRLATAFNRLHLQNEEGGVVAEEFRIAYIVDRVNTMGTAFLGLTMECSRCHDHKYDPITQEDFYSLAAYFANIDEYGQTTYFTSAMPVPTLLLPDTPTEARLVELGRLQEQATADYEQQQVAATERFEAWLTHRTRATEPAKPVTHIPFDDNTAANLGDPATPLGIHDGADFVPGRLGQAGRCNGDNGFNSGKLGAFTRTDPFTISAWLQPGVTSERQVVYHWSMAAADAGSRGYELLLEQGRVAFGLHHMWPGNSLKVTTRTTIEPGTWTLVTVTYDGSSRAEGLVVYLNGERADVEVIRDKLTKDITYDGSAPEFQIGFRFRDNGYRGGLIDDLRIYPSRLTAIEVAELFTPTEPAPLWQTATSELTEDQMNQLRDYYLTYLDAPVLAARQTLRTARKEYSQAINPVPEVMVMQELPTPKPTYILTRGAYDAPGKEATARPPGFLPALSTEWAPNRLGLAQWLTHPEHPLTARVVVNRAWQQCFGVGLVETTDNFGVQGSAPTHPELLDWLARDFIAHDWDYHHLLRQMVLSATYRQSSRGAPQVVVHDPRNLLLARAPVRRLSAEMLRDQALSVSGLLVEQLGGASVKPYQPAGLWDVGGGSYDQGHGNDLYRRSLYTFWKRTIPPPTMLTFDAAERNVCIVRRQATSTPLQALALLNDVQMVEACRLLAERMLVEGGSDPVSRIAWGGRVVLGVPLTSQQQSVLQQLLDEQRAYFQADSAAVDALLTVGERPSTAGLDRVELAALTVLAQALLNLDGAVFLR